jgi:hypothetical protein
LFPEKIVAFKKRKLHLKAEKIPILNTKLAANQGTILTRGTTDTSHLLVFYSHEPVLYLPRKPGNV